MVRWAPLIKCLIVHKTKKVFYFYLYISIKEKAIIMT